MQLDSRQLDAFLAVLESGSFEAAARRLRVTPSAVSQRIKQLEDRLGQVLLRRSSPVAATHAGRRLLRHAKQMSLLELEALRDLLPAAAQDGRLPTLPLVVNADSLDTWFRAALAAVAASRSMLLEISVEDQDHSLELLRSGQVLGAISADARAVQGCRLEQLGVMRYRAVASPQLHREHFAGGPTADAFARAPTLTYNRKDDLQARFVRLVCRKRVALREHFVPSFYAFNEAVCGGIGWGMVPVPMADGWIADGRLVDLAAGVCVEIPLYWQCWRIKSDLLDRLTREIRAAARSGLPPV
jgi:LysR family transcriptional regulator (chromosome initiation inhibitor)